MRLDRAFVETRIVEWNDLFQQNQNYGKFYILRSR